MAGIVARAPPVITVPTDSAAELGSSAALRPAKLFIGGITRHTTTKQLRDHFARYGRVLDCVAMRQPDGRPRGFGYVTLDSPAAADRCLAEPQVIDGRVVDMKRAVPEGSAGGTPMGYEAGHSPLASSSEFFAGMPMTPHHPGVLGWPSVDVAGLLPLDMAYGANAGLADPYWGHAAAAAASAAASAAALEAPGLRPLPSKPTGREALDCVELLRGGMRLPAPVGLPFSAPPTPTGASGMLSASAPEFVPMAIPQKAVGEAGKRRSPLQPVFFSDENRKTALTGAAAEPLKIGLSENEPKSEQQQAKRPRAVLGEITNITNIMSEVIVEGKKNIAPPAKAAEKDQIIVFEGDENAAAEPTNQKARKPQPTPIATDDDSLENEEDTENVAPVKVESSTTSPTEEDAAETPAATPEVDIENLPSMGSVEHHLGTCKRCNFFPKGRCQNGKDCTFCHFPHDKRKPSRQEKRERRAAWLSQQDGQPYEDSQDDDEEGEEGDEGEEVDVTMAYSIFPGLPPMRATKLPAPLALPGSYEVPGFPPCLPPGLPPPAPARQGPPMLGLDMWQQDEEVGPMRCSPTAATARSMSVLSTVPSVLSTSPVGAQSMPRSLLPSPTASMAPTPTAAASFAVCSAPPTPSAASMAAARGLPVPQSMPARVTCTIATQTEEDSMLCQQCLTQGGCACASKDASARDNRAKRMWSREDMLRVRETVVAAKTPSGQPSVLRTMSSSTVECQ